MNGNLRALLAAALVAPAVALAQGSPAQPITVIVPFPAGGIADSSVRAIAAKVSESTGQQVLDNRGGAGGQIGASAAKTAKPDGSTLFLANIGTHAVNATLDGKLTYDPVKDFEPVTQLLAWTHLLVVPADSKARTVADLIARAKANPGKLSFASQGVGSGGHLLGEMFKAAAGIDASHVPYRGSAQVMQDLLAGRIDFFFDGVGIIPFAKDNKVRVLAVADPKRMAEFPSVPTTAEAGFAGVTMTAWFGLVAPAGTPKPVIAKLNEEFAKAAKHPDVTKKLAEQGIQTVTSTPAQFAAFMASETERLGKVVKASGARAD
jgi:tripartite-type tricarboxylate transporter receptor subunit TctC